MDEEIKITCTDCKDLEFARNLARSMKEGYGRHVSSQFRINPTRPPVPSGPVNPDNLTYAEMDAIIRQRMLVSDHAFHSFLQRRCEFDLSYGESRVIGRAGDNKIRTSMLDCEIGDMVPTTDKYPNRPFYDFKPPQEVDGPHGSRRTTYESWCKAPEPVSFQPIERWTFEHVHTRMTRDNGATWAEEYFWKRIS